MNFYKEYDLKKDFDNYKEISRRGSDMTYTKWKKRLQEGAFTRICQDGLVEDFKHWLYSEQRMHGQLYTVTLPFGLASFAIMSSFISLLTKNRAAILAVLILVLCAVFTKLLPYLQRTSMQYEDMLSIFLKFADEYQPIDEPTAE